MKDIGEKFELCGKSFIAKEEHDGCDGCAFKATNFCRDAKCSFEDREDRQSVIFEEVLISEYIDPVKKPAHYNQGKFEVIEIIEDLNLNFNLGNAIKYIARCNHKGNKKQDLEKSIWYIEREISKI
jgi:hypothetical protein